MNIGDRFEKDGKTYEVTSVNPWGIGYKKVNEDIVVFEKEPEEIPEPVKEPEKKPRKRTKK